MTATQRPPAMSTAAHAPRPSALSAPRSRLRAPTPAPTAEGVPVDHRSDPMSDQLGGLAFVENLPILRALCRARWTPLPTYTPLTSEAPLNRAADRLKTGSLASSVRGGGTKQCIERH